MDKKYALHAGYVTSKHDGERHYISASRLAVLYRLNRSEYVIWDAIVDRYQPEEVWNRYVHLYPSYEGNYGRPDA